jgi:hypothetical protein
MCLRITWCIYILFDMLHFVKKVKITAVYCMCVFVPHLDVSVYNSCTAPAAINYPSLRNSLNGCQGHLPPCLSLPDRPRVTKLDSNDVRTRSVLFNY